MGELMGQFVCVRLIQANALDLSVFQFDYDLTFAVFFLNADRTIYGRYGSRSHQKETERDISPEGFAEAMRGALDLHKGYPANKATLAGKQGRAVPFATPDDMPRLKGKFGPQLDYQGKLMASCLHCHQIRDAEREALRKEKKPLSDEMLFPWPGPATIGLTLSPKHKGHVVEVAPKSPAAEAGFLAGDDILSVENQPILSTADLQWILEGVKPSGKLEVKLRREDGEHTLSLSLAEGWRRASDITWRTTTWDLRRMALGGLVLEEAPSESRASAKIPDDSLALLVKYVGQYGEHAVGKGAGFKEGDIITAVEGKKERLNEGQLIRYLLQNHEPGQSVSMTIQRAAEEKQKTLLQQ